MRRLLALAAVAILAACGGQPLPASPSPSKPPVAMRVNWSAITGAMSGLWTAYEAGYFKEENLDVELIPVASSSRSIDAMLAGEIQLGYLDVRNVVEAVARGADVRAVIGVTNRLVFSAIASAKIEKTGDLKGKKLGITRAGSSTHTAALQALKLWGLQPNTDVTLVQLFEVPNILAALQAGQIDAGIVSPPTNTRAKKAGFKELLNLAVDGPEYPSVAVGGKTSYLISNPDAVRAFIRGYSRGVQRFLIDKAFGTKAVKGYLQVDDQAVLDDTWEQFTKYLAMPPAVRGIEAVLADVAVDEPKARAMKPEQVLDATFVKQLEESGYFKQLTGR